MKTLGTTGRTHGAKEITLNFVAIDEEDRRSGKLDGNRFLQL